MSSLLALLGLVGFYTSLVKLAALLYKRARLSWRDACIFSMMVLVVLGGGILLNRLSGDAIPDWLSLIACMVIQMGIGAWYLAPRGHNRSGDPLGSQGAAILALIAYALLMPILIALTVMFSAMRH